MQRPDIQRRPSRLVLVGGVPMGGGAPITVQSMTNTPTADAAATLAQIHRLVDSGCQIVRVTAASAEDTAALPAIVAGSPVPVVADVHFHFRRALEAVAAGVHKIRLNPGNIADRDQVRAVIAACRARGVAIRVGVNEGSVLDRADAAHAAAQRQQPLHELMADTIAGYLEVFAEQDFSDLVLSAKSSDAVTTVAVYRLLAQRYDYPLHLGLTHAGTLATGLVRSAAALGALLAEGIGDTIRISLAGEGVEEVRAACELLASLRLRPRQGVEIIACPTCGRTSADVAGIAEQVRAALAHVRRHVRVAVMGCVVNGPGEAAEADVAACCGAGKAALYRHGRLVATVPLEALLPGLLEQVQAVLKEEE